MADIGFRTQVLVKDDKLKSSEPNPCGVGRVYFFLHVTTGPTLQTVGKNEITGTLSAPVDNWPMKSPGEQLAHEEKICHKWDLSLDGEGNIFSSQASELHPIDKRMV